MATNNVFNVVLPKFSGLEESFFEDTFGPSRTVVQNQIGDLFIQNRFNDEHTLSHAQLTIWLGQYAMYSIPNTSYRFWADTSAYTDDLPWKLAVWRLIHILPIGHAFANHAFKINDLTSWNPLQQPACRGIEVKGSNRPLYPNTISQGLFHKLFPDYFESESPMFISALLDVFAPSPNRDNPFYIAVRNTIRITLIKSPYPIPYFWHQFILSFLSQSETDLKMYRDKDKSFSNGFDDLQPLTDTVSGAHTDIKLPPNTEQSVPTKPSGESASPLLHTLLQDINLDVSDNPDYDKITALLNEIGSLVSQKIDSGDFPINAPGAFAHKINNKMYINYPTGIQRIHSLLGDAISAEQLEQFFINLALIVLRQGLVSTNSGIVKDIELAELHSQFVSVFFPDSENLPNNPNIQIRTPKPA